MNTKMKLQVIDEYDEDKADFYIWDFSDPGHDYMAWFMWFANDPPDEIRITCADQELLDAMRAFWANHYTIQETVSSLHLYQEGDEVWKSGWGNHVIINPNLETIE